MHIQQITKYHFCVGGEGVNQFFMCNHLYSQGWKKYRTTGPLVPEIFLSPQNIF